jgi:hypothetical protein
MTIQLELNPAAEASLAKVAERRKSDVTEVAQDLLEAALQRESRLTDTEELPERSIEERIAALRSLAKIVPPGEPGSDAGCTWPRSLIYEDDHLRHL